MFIPCSKSPHKPDYVPASAEHRLAMARVAVRGYDCFTVSDVEIARGGMSYTTDTIGQLREEFGSEVELWLLTGMDAYLDLRTWKDPDGIASECFFGVACRPGYNREKVAFPPAARTRFVDITPVDISSTDIRRRLLEGRTIRYLVPDSVEAYIRGNRPYPEASKG
jgi:nicotinate-nucleotide adenylyltransferase